MGLINIFKSATRVRTKMEFLAFCFVLFLFFILLWIIRCPNYDEAGLWVYGDNPSLVAKNTLLDILVSFVLSTVFFIIF